MTMSNGIDLVCVSEFAKLACELDSPFVRATFTTEEVRRATSSPGNVMMRLAGIYAAKEAAIKAIDGAHLFRPPVIKALDYRDFEVMHDDYGRPYFLFHGPVRDTVKNLNTRPSLSLSHDGDYATAFVVLL